jgi:methylase of polypeptide subunit release factors
LFPSQFTSSFDEWILKIDEWLSDLWNPCTEASVASVLLSILWDAFERDLADNLRRARVAAGIPPSGGVLAFVAGLTKCIVIRYRFAGLTPKLDPVAVIDHPLSAFDFWGAIDEANANSRNLLKSILASGHKLIYHRGVLAHVDRRTDSSVFGPSIDTILMAELLAREYFEHERESPVSTVLEIGSGSGFLSAGVALHLKTLKELVCIDADSQAVTCTAKNIKIAAAVPGVAPFTSHLIVGPFSPNLLGRKKFDLIICNPPYIPKPRLVELDRSSDYLLAVSGTELLKEVVEAAPGLLTDSGQLLLMLSDLSFGALPGVQKKLAFPLGPRGFQVIFDVEAALSNTRWMDYLKETCGLTNDPRDERVHFHTLHPGWMRL